MPTMSRNIDDRIVELVAQLVQAGITIRDMLQPYLTLMKEIMPAYEKILNATKPQQDKNLRNLFTGTLELKFIDSVCFAPKEWVADLNHSLDLIEKEIASANQEDRLNKAKLLEFTHCYRKCFEFQSRELGNHIVGVKNLLEGIRSESIDALLTSGSLSDINQISSQQLRSDVVKKLERMDAKGKENYLSDLEKLQLQGERQMIASKMLPLPKEIPQLPAGT